MKEIFKELRTQLMDLEDINWVDINKGQINNYEVRPPIDFPAVLLTLNMPRTTKLSGKDQQCEVLITADIVFDCIDDTDSSTQDDALEESLAIYDVANDVYKTLQGQSLSGVLRAPMERIAQQEPRRADKLKVIQITFSTRYIDKSAN